MMSFSSGVNWRFSVMAIIHSACVEQRLQLVHGVAEHEGKMLKAEC
jgi:hypothetical protein